MSLNVFSYQLSNYSIKRDYGKCEWGRMGVLSIWVGVVESSRLHHLIPICQQRRNPLKSAISARRGSVRTACGGRSSFQSCVPADLGFRPRETLSRHRRWYGRIASPPGSNNAASAQPNPQSPLNYAAMLITRESTRWRRERASTSHTTGFSLTLSAVFHSPAAPVISKGETESWEFSKRDARAVPTIIRGNPSFPFPSSYDVVLISKVRVNISQSFLLREDGYVRYMHRVLWNLKD